MATDSIAAAIRVFQPAAKAIPVVGTILDGVLGSVLELYKIVERLKTNHKLVKDLVDRVGLLSLAIARNYPHLPGSTSQDVRDLQTILQDTTLCVQRLEAGNSKTSFVQFAKRVGSAEKENDEIQRLGKKVSEAIELFQISTSMEALSYQIHEQDNGVQTYLHDVLKPVHEALFDSYAAPTGCLQGTRGGILDELLEWIFSATSERMFWLCGMAGTGKSAVARTVCDLVTEHLSHVGAHLTTFFISHDSPARREPLRILHTLLYFLARANPDFRQKLHQTLRDRPELALASLDKQARHLVRGSLPDYDGTNAPIIVVIDALDECDKGEGGELLRILLPLVEQTKLHIRLVFTARPQPSIETVFSSIEARRFVRLDEIHASTVQEDVESYFSFHFPSLRRDRIVSLAIRSNGLFIYAATVVRFVKLNEFFGEEELLHSFLQEGPSVRSEVSTPAVDYGPLDDVYLRVLRGVIPTGGSTQNRQAAARLVRSVIVTLVSLNDYVSPPLLARLMGRNIDQVEKVLKRLSAVLTIDADGVIRLLHLSFSEFILDMERCTDPLFHPNVLPEGHAELTVVDSTTFISCMDILVKDLSVNICHIDLPGHTNAMIPDLQRRVEKYVSRDLLYASKHWASHMMGIPPRNSARSPLVPLMRSFCRTPVISLWIELMILLKCSHRMLMDLSLTIHWWKQSLDDDIMPLDLRFRERSCNADDVLLALRRTSVLVQTAQRKMGAPPPQFILESAAIVVFTSNDDSIIAPRDGGDNLNEPYVMRMIYESDRFERWNKPTYHRNCASIVSLSGDGTYVAAAYSDSVVIWDGVSGSRPARVTMPDDCPVTEMQLSFNGLYLVATSRPPWETDTTFVIFVRRESLWLSSHVWVERISKCLRLGAISSDGQSIAMFVTSRFGEGRGGIVMKSVTSKLSESRPGMIHSQAYTASATCHLSFSPDSRILVASHSDGQVTAWTRTSATNLEQGRSLIPRSQRFLLASPKQWGQLWSEFSQDGKQLFCGNLNGQALSLAVDYSDTDSGLVPSYRFLATVAKEDNAASMHIVRWVYVLPLQ